MYAMENGNFSIASFFDTMGKQSLPRHVFLSLWEEGSRRVVFPFHVRGWFVPPRHGLLSICQGGIEVAEG